MIKGTLGLLVICLTGSLNAPDPGAWAPDAVLAVAPGPRQIVPPPPSTNARVRQVGVRPRPVRPRNAQTPPAPAYPPRRIAFNALPQETATL